MGVDHGLCGHGISITSWVEIARITIVYTKERTKRGRAGMKKTTGHRPPTTDSSAE
jgi:hypothetical protein